MIFIDDSVSIDDDEIELSAIRAQGAGGQNVNKVSSAVHLRFDIGASSLPAPYKERLLAMSDQRITREGIVIIKAQAFRSQEKNRGAAILRLQEMIRQAAYVQKARRATKPTRNSQIRRVDSKKLHARTKATRARVTET